MEPFNGMDNGTIRMSNSPRRSPRIIQGLKSPARSLHPQLAQSASSHSQKDPGMKTLDFFEDSSEDGENSPRDPADTAPDIDGLERRGSATKKRQSHPPVPSTGHLASQCESKSLKLSPTQDGYQPLSPTVWADAPDRVPERANTPSTSFNGSVDELLPSNMHSSPPQCLRNSRISSGRGPRSSSHIPRSDDRPSSLPLPRSDDRKSSVPSVRPKTVFDAFAVAHEITLQALMRDEEGLDRSLQGMPLAPLQAADRRSLLPVTLSSKDDPRSPQNNDFSSLQSNKQTQGDDQTVTFDWPITPPWVDPDNPFANDPRVRVVAGPLAPGETPAPNWNQHPHVSDSRQPHEFSSSKTATTNGSKKVHVLPPPMDLTGIHRRSLPADLVRTPYPFSPQRTIRKDFGHQQTHPPEPSPAATESVLTLSIRRTHANSKPRVTSITMPAAANNFTAVRNSGTRQKEQHFKALDFDDAELFRQIRAAYIALSGRGRLFSARSLSRIVVAPGSRVDGGGGWHAAPRSPRELAYKGLNDTFSEEKLMLHFRRPVKGKSQYAFVHWAHRLAGSPLCTPRPGEGDELVRRGEQVEGLEFVVCWSVGRILAVGAVVIGLSVAAALLWVLLGRSSRSLPPGVGEGQAGFRGAGDRVEGGVLMGICTLLLGLSGMGGWLGVSWLVM